MTGSAYSVTVRATAELKHELHFQTPTRAIIQALFAYIHTFHALKHALQMVYTVPKGFPTG